MCPCNKSEQSDDHILYECDLVKKEIIILIKQIQKTVQKICRLNRFRKTTDWMKPQYNRTKNNKKMQCKYVNYW